MGKLRSEIMRTLVLALAFAAAAGHGVIGDLVHGRQPVAADVFDDLPIAKG